MSHTHTCARDFKHLNKVCNFGEHAVSLKGSFRLFQSICSKPKLMVSEVDNVTCVSVQRHAPSQENAATLDVHGIQRSLPMSRGCLPVSG